MTEVLAPPGPDRIAAAPAPRRTVNQTLCAAAHLVEGFADYIFFLADDRTRAGAPSITEDPVAVLRHAAVARRSQRGRDLLCSLIALVAVAVVTTAVAARLGSAAAAAIVGAIILGCALRRLLRRWSARLWKWSWNSRRAGRRRLILSLVLTAVVAAVGLGVLARQAMLWDCLAVVVSAFVLAWLVVLGESVLALRRAARIVDRSAPPPECLARPLRRGLERRTAALSGVDVIAYGEPRATAPFVGSGFLARPAKLDVDVNRLADDGGSGPDGPRPFDVVAFHERLNAQFQLECAVESTGTRKLEAGHRLYLDGRRIPWDSDLMDDGRPSARVGWDYLAEELRHPERADDRRVYFYLQEVVRGGEIGVCVCVRPLLQGGKLSIEFVTLILPPIDPWLEAVVAEVPTRIRRQIGRALRSRTRGMVAGFLDAPGRCAVRSYRWLARLAAVLLWREARWSGEFRDVGAVMSVREGVSWDEPKEFDHFMIRDIIRIHDQLQERLVESIVAYLRELGIDTSSLEKDVSVTNVQNWSVGNIQADMVGFGNNNTFSRPGGADNSGDNGKGKS